jgi:beta propeller repeat protein
MAAPQQNVATRAWLRCLALALGVFALASPASARPAHVPGELLVRFHAEGPHALRECAQALAEGGRGFARASADGSDSLDRLHAELGVRELRALFRRPDGRPFEEQRERLRTRREALRSGRPAPSSERGRDLPDLSHIYRVRLPRGGDVERAAALYRADPHVAWAQPNFLVEADYQPDDPFYTSSGSWGQAFRDLWGLERLRTPLAWDVAQGEGIVVAVVDTGLDYDHPDIAANVWINPGEDLNGNGVVDAGDFNGIDDDDNGFVDDLRGFDFANSEDADGDGLFDGPDDISDADPFDDHGHGTHVAGTIAAVGDNAIGVVGVAPRARIMPLKGFRREGPSSIELLSRAMIYAIDNGARVINNSWSCSARCPNNPVAEEVVALANALGVVVVTSAGNNQDDVVFYSPENKRGTIAVAASTEIDGPAYFTNRGLLVDVAAPGAGEQIAGVRLAHRAVLSLRSSDATPAIDAFGEAVVGDDYVRLAGTSMSSPHVAGIVALLLAQRPELAPDEVRALLRISADDVGAPGHDRASGAGIADAARALGTPLPGALAEIASPRPGSLLRQQELEIAIEGTAAGPEFQSYALWVGEGREPTIWQPLVRASETPVEAGLLAVWPVEDLSNGAYVVRLDVTTRSGTVLVELLPLGLERILPTRVSSEGEPAFAPVLSGERVVWQSARPTSEVLEDGEEGLNLFVTDLRRGVEAVLADGPGDQRAAAIDGRRVAWLDGRSGDPHEIFHCAIEPGQQPCRARPLARGDLVRRPPALSNARVTWEEIDERSELRLCAFEDRAGDCSEIPLAPGAGPRVDPTLEGDLLIWTAVDPGGFRVVFCDLGSGACEPTPVGSLRSAQQIAASGTRLAWNHSGGLILSCELDVATGSCPMEMIAGLGNVDSTTQVAISGDRLVWDAPEREGGRDLYFCEFDPVTRACPIQRLTGSPAREIQPDIDGARVVWQDDRNGPWQIMRFDLPGLQPLRDRVIREGQRLVVRVVAEDRGGIPLALEAAQADGSPLESIGASFSDLGDGSGVLSWRPGFDRAGSYAVTFTGTSPERLQTRRTIRIEVQDARRTGDFHWSPSRESRPGQRPLARGRGAESQPET